MNTMAVKPQRSLANLLLNLSVGDSQIELETFTDAMNLVLLAKRRMTGKFLFTPADMLTAINTYRQIEAQFTVQPTATTKTAEETG